jgi:hypothetical protein
MHTYVIGEFQNTVYIYKENDHYDAIIKKPEWNSRSVNTTKVTRSYPSNENKRSIYTHEKTHKNPNQPNKKRLSNRNSLAIYHLNVRSLVPKIDEVRDLIEKLKADVLCITETWLHDKILDVDVSIDGFSLLRKDRIDKHGGGVAIYIRENIIYKVRQDITSSNATEMVWAEIITASSRPNILVSCIYRPPNSNPDYYDLIVDALEKAHSEDKDILLLGDLNYNYVIDENLHKNPIYMLETLFSMQQLISNPTRVSNHTTSLLDIILTTSPQCHMKSGVLEYGLSDHYIIFTHIDVSHQKREHKECRFRDFKNFNCEAFVLACKSAFDNIFSTYDISKSNCVSPPRIESIWSNWKNSFLKISDEFAPFKTVRLKNRVNKWITPDIVKLQKRILTQKS